MWKGLGRSPARARARGDRIPLVAAESPAQEGGPTPGQRLWIPSPAPCASKAESPAPTSPRHIPRQARPPPSRIFLRKKPSSLCLRTQRLRQSRGVHSVCTRGPQSLLPPTRGQLGLICSLGLVRSFRRPRAPFPLGDTHSLEVILNPTARGQQGLCRTRRPLRRLPLAGTDPGKLSPSRAGGGSC